jgi:hypothetical protein
MGGGLENGASTPAIARANLTKAAPIAAPTPQKEDPPDSSQEAPDE